MSVVNRFSGSNGTHTMDLAPQSQPPALVSTGGLTLSAESVKRTMESLLRIREFVLANLEPGIDIIEMPGLDRKILAQPGSEKIGYLLSGWYQHDTIEHELGGGHLEVVITSRLISHGSGSILGEGIGSCSTREVKYCYRNGKRTCPSCGSDQLNKSKDRPEYYCWAKKGGCGETFGLDDPRITSQVVGRVENPDIHDVRNTVRKMAAKRADIDCAKRTCCLSGFVTQDLDEFAPNDIPHDDDRPRDRKPAPAPAPSPSPSPAPLPRSQAKPQGDRRVQRTGEASPSPGRELWNKVQTVKNRNPNVIKALGDFGKSAGFPARIVDWSAEQARAGEEELLRLDRIATEPAIATEPVAPGALPGAGLKQELINLSNKSGHLQLLGEVSVWGRSQGFSSRMSEWTDGEVSVARAYAKDLLQDLSREGGA